MNFRPSLNFGKRGDVGKQSGYDDGQNCAKGLGDAVFGTQLGYFLRHWMKISRGADWEIGVSMGENEQCEPFSYWF